MKDIKCESRDGEIIFLNQSEIEFMAVKTINGVKHMTGDQIWQAKYTVCYHLGIKKGNIVFRIIEESFKKYFAAINSVELKQIQS